MAIYMDFCLLFYVIAYDLKNLRYLSHMISFIFYVIMSPDETFKLKLEISPRPAPPRPAPLRPAPPRPASPSPADFLSSTGISCAHAGGLSTSEKTKAPTESIQQIIRASW